MPRKKREKPTRLAIDTMDGAQADIAAMRDWMDAHGVEGTVEQANWRGNALPELMANLNLARIIIIEITKRDHAVMWMMRWGEDYRRLEKERAEGERATAEASRALAKHIDAEIIKDLVTKLRAEQ